jgi:effector-binding domain-containing protein
VASVTVKGPYAQIPAHYTEMLAWLSAEGWEIDGPPREVYIKRPKADGSGDPAAFVTEIQFPIKQ